MYPTMKLISLTVGSKEFDEIAKHITKSYPNACIMFIDKLEAPPFENEYIALKTSMKEPNEQLLFHGTTEESARSILQSGYDPLMNRRAAYGTGTYFSASASYSKDYMDISTRTIGFELSYMLINTVLVGRVCQGSSKNVINPTLHDSQVDNLYSPTIFAIPRKEQAIPRYFVGFHKGAT
jgi:hypothetical protein